MGLINVGCLKPDPGPYPRGRRCAEPGCATILHTRHEGDHCYLHAPEESGALVDPMDDIFLMNARSIDSLMRQAA